MVRIHLDVELKDVKDARGRIKEEGFRLLEAQCVERTDQHPESKERFFEERYGHPEGNVLRFFPYCKFASGPRQGEPIAQMIEFKPLQAG